MARLIYWIERWHDWRERRGERRGDRVVSLYRRLARLQAGRPRW